MSKARVYTRGGDAGDTQLLSVGRVAKHHPRLAAYGDCDELNSVIGLAVAADPHPPLADQLVETQAVLFVLGSQLAVPDPDSLGMPIPTLEPRHTEQLEGWIDALDAELAPLSNFILPGGTPAAAHLHHARTVARRCERAIGALHAETALAETVLTYINRLSDYLFTAARYDNQRRGVADVAWRP